MSGWSRPASGTPTGRRRCRETRASSCLPGGQQHHERRAAEARRRARATAGQRGREPHRDWPARRPVGDRGPGPVGTGRSSIGASPAAARPTSRGRPPACSRPAMPAGVVGVLYLRRSGAARPGPSRAAYRAASSRSARFRRPGVEGDVVHDEQQHVLVGAGAGRTARAQRRLAQRERPGDTRSGSRAPAVRGTSTHLDRAPRRRVAEDRDGCAVVGDGAQHVVAVARSRTAAVSAAASSGAGQPQGGRHVVGGAVRSSWCRNHSRACAGDSGAGVRVGGGDRVLVARRRRRAPRRGAAAISDALGVGDRHACATSASSSDSSRAAKPASDRLFEQQPHRHRAGPGRRGAGRRPGSPTASARRGRRSCRAPTGRRGRSTAAQTSATSCSASLRGGDPSPGVVARARAARAVDLAGAVDGQGRQRIQRRGTM